MSKPVRIAVQLPPQHSEYRDIRSAALRAEEEGADIIYIWDHFFPLFGDADGKHFECWTTLSSLAEATSRAELGVLVTCFTYRNPHLLADMARTVDHISDGRLILGLGSGWFERDYEEYGYEFGTAAGRLRALDAGLDIIKTRWERLNPPPTRRIPILIGGGGEKMTLPITARHADSWHSFGEPDVFRHKSGVLDRACRDIGRDPAEIERSITVGEDGFETAEQLAELGASQFVLHVNGPQFDMVPLGAWAAWRADRNAGAG